MIFVLIIFLLLILMFNLYITHGDIFNPASLLTIVFLIASTVGSVGAVLYNLSIHFNTFMVILIGPIIFTIINILFRRKKEQKVIDVEFIKLSNKVTIIILLLQVVCIIERIHYLRSIASGIGYDGAALSTVVGLYNEMSKVNPDAIARVGYDISTIYKLCRPFVNTVPYILFHVMINNHIYDKKIKNYYQVASVVLLLIYSFFSGGRGGILQCIVFLMVDYYIIKYKYARNTSKNIYFYFKSAVIAILFIFGIFFSLSLFGREYNNGLFSYIFIYLSGAIFNLDRFLNNASLVSSTGVIGAYTFKLLYSYLLSKGVVDSRLIGNNSFAHGYAPGGIKLGNVYTMYMPFISDFGIVGAIGLIGIMAFYYCYAYNNIKGAGTNRKFDTRTFFYSYLSYNLLMSIFSSYFYDGVITVSFLYFIVINWAFYCIFIEKKFLIGKKKINIKK